VILHPGILALIVGSLIVFAMMLYAGFIGFRILAKWDFESSSEEQLTLERKTYLVSTLASYALGFEIISGLLFLYTVDDLHELFVGAMCATGSLNANPVGWSVLWVKGLILLLAPIWIAFNRFDQQAGDYPIIRPKYVGLLLLTPLVALDLVQQVRFFAGLEPEIITSCCGALFSESGSTVASELAGLPVRPMMIVFYIGVALFVATSVACLLNGSRFLRYLLSGISVAVLLVSLASIVSFLSLYIYELPTHHCPFDMIQKSYSFIGYPIYLTLFAGVYFGLLPGLFQPLRKIPSLTDRVAAAEPGWLTAGLVFMLVFVCIASWPVMFGSLIMTGH